MDEKFRVMPQLDSFYYFEEYLVGGGAVFIMYYLFRYYIIPWEICRSKIVSGLELDTYKSEADYRIIGGVFDETEENIN